MPALELPRRLVPTIPAPSAPGAVRRPSPNHRASWRDPRRSERVPPDRMPHRPTDSAAVVTDIDYAVTGTALFLERPRPPSPLSSASP